MQTVWQPKYGYYHGEAEMLNWLNHDREIIHPERSQESHHNTKISRITRYDNVHSYQSNQSRLNVLFIDEANLTQRQWSEFSGLFNQPPGIFYQGKYYHLRPNDKVIFCMQSCFLWR